MRIGFLFNHEHYHQVPHAATVGFALSTLPAPVEVEIIVSSRPQLDYLIRLEKLYPDHRCRYVSISLPRRLRAAGAVLDKALPFTKVMMLRHNLDTFRGLDALVVPEKTSLLLRKFPGMENLKIIYTAHGAGDRAIGFDAETAKFDLIFLSGPKIERRMRDAGILDRAASRIIGYPKFDAVGAFTRPRDRLFDNDRPTVLYNPHFYPSLSSWFRMGMDILDYFLASREYNLILAPHVMLYRRKLHVAPDNRRLGWVRKLPARFLDCPHILVDTGGPSCTDMTYTLAADIYLGDASSQVWEFLVHPRPCLFADAHATDWRDDPNYLHWRNGPVFTDPGRLEESLKLAVDTHPRFRPVQEALFRDTFDIREESSSTRGARAILRFMEESLNLVRN